MNQDAQSEVTRRRGIWERLRNWSRSRSAPGVEGSAEPGVKALTATIKDELRRRFDRGECPTVAEYLERFPQLRDEPGRVVSLVYEEFCLLEENGAHPDPRAFCERYAPWKDSLASQLRFHRELSQIDVSGPIDPGPRFPEPGEDFLWYRIAACLGQGGSARVYLAHDQTLGGRKVVLKVALKQGDEPSLQGRLDHPHIVAVTAVEQDEASGLSVLCMPYYPGLPLDAVIRRIDPARTRPTRAQVLWDGLGPPEEDDDHEIEAAGRPAWGRFPRKGPYADGAAWLALKLAEALSHAHRRGVLHRDIKPANILLTRRGGPMLLDFNLSQAVDAARDAESAATGGTLPYMAPEQLGAFLDPSRWNEVSVAADIYSLGLVLRELLTGQRPDVPDENLPPSRAISQLHDRRVDARPESVRKLSPGVPYALDAIVAKCLAPRVEDRYEDANALIQDLNRYLKRESLRNARNPSRREVAVNFARRHRAVPVAAALLLVAGGFAAYEAMTHDFTKWKLKVHLDGAWDAAQSQDLEQATNRYQLAMQLDRNDYRPWQGLASMAFRYGNYRRSSEFFDRAVKLAAADPQIPKSVRIDLRQGRLDSALRIGREDQDHAVGLAIAAQGRRTPEAVRLIGEAARSFDMMRRDQSWIIQARTLGATPNDERGLALAWLGIGDTASFLDDYPGSVAAFRNAEQHCGRALQLDAARNWPQRKDVETLARNIKDRLHADLPKLVSSTNQ